MRMVLLIFDESRREELELFLEGLGVAGYTELSRVRGVGATGRRLGSGAFPGTSTLVFSVVDGATYERLRRGLAEIYPRGALDLRIFTWEVEEVALPAGTQAKA